MKIPFTNINVSFSGNASEQGQKRPLVMTKNTNVGFLNPEHDMTGTKLDFEVLYQAYRQQSDVNACVREWCDNTGAAGFELIDTKNKDAEVPEWQEDELKTTLNYGQTWRYTLKQTVQSLGVCDNAFWYLIPNFRSSRILGVQCIDPRTMGIVTDKYGTVLRYIQKVGVQDPVVFMPEEILHLKLRTDPNAPVFGFSPMEPVIWEIRTDVSAMMSNFYFFENDAKPSVQYILDDEGMTQEQVDDAIENIKKQFGGVKNRNKSGVLSGVKEVKVLSVSHQDMQFLEGRRFTTEKVCAAYGVPKFLLGYTETTNNNNGTELLKKFYKGTIEPIEDMIAETITRSILPLIGLGSNIKFSFKPQSFDEQKELEERALKEMQSGALTLRQYKKKTGQEIMPEDENNPNIDAHVVFGGSSAVLLEDVGVAPQTTSQDQQTQQNALAQLLIPTNK